MMMFSDPTSEVPAKPQTVITLIAMLSNARSDALTHSSKRDERRSTIKASRFEGGKNVLSHRGILAGRQLKGRREYVTCALRC